MAYSFETHKLFTSAEKHKGRQKGKIKYNQLFNADNF